MRTLARECFSKDWIDTKSRELRTGNTFLEKCLHAFELLGRLQQEGLDFVFKGGTSLLLRLPTPKRLSIDIDVISRERPKRLERIWDIYETYGPYAVAKSKPVMGGRGKPCRTGGGFLS